MNNEVFDYIFDINNNEPKLANIGKDLNIDIKDIILNKQDKVDNLTTLNKIKESFKYWYPVDLRCSAKDLISNHLIMNLKVK